jgi:hypothetical protein
MSVWFSSVGKDEILTQRETGLQNFFQTVQLFGQSIWPHVRDGVS